VGHPLVERLADLRPDLREAERRRAEPPLVLVLPGSRSSEIRLLLAVFGEAIARVSARAGAMELVLPTMPHLLPRVSAGIAGWPVKPRIVTDPAEKWAAFRSARAALAASGTVTLELALAGVPTVAAYRITFVEEIIARVARIKQRLSSVILANLVLGENIVPELLQHDCTPDRLAEALVPLLSDTPAWRRQIEAFARLDNIMGLTTMPSAEAAAVVLHAARTGRGPHLFADVATS
jgi:lipid-A-disaccharide synthase